jgi:hypothetical protein
LLRSDFQRKYERVLLRLRQVFFPLCPAVCGRLSLHELSAVGCLSCVAWKAGRLRSPQKQDATERESFHYALAYGCLNGHLDVVRWLADFFGLTLEEQVGPPEIVLRALPFISAAGRLDVLKWLLRAFQLGDARFVSSWAPQALAQSCASGELRVAKWLAGEFALGTEDAKWGGNAALILSCENGHLAVAKWLTEWFDLTKGDAGTDRYAALRSALERRHFDVAKWFVDRFDLRLVVPEDPTELLADWPKVFPDTE